MNSSAIFCSRLSVQFGDGSRAVDSVDLKISAGEIVALIGPSGCGKTTLLRCIAGLQPPTSGDVVFDPVAQSSEGEIGFVFQQPSLLPWATTLENVMLPLDLIGWRDVGERREAAIESLQAVQLGEAIHKRPDELSGGMQMRASIARALVTQPSVLLLDEPFAALDEMLRNDLGNLLLKLWDQRGFTAVMVTHNVGESILLSHRIAVMRDGKLETLLENSLPWPRQTSLMRTSEFAEFYGNVGDALRGANAGFEVKP
ncbi:MAG: ABC transporter ATP-binding protein [Planctomycetota bacterium]